MSTLTYPGCSDEAHPEIFGPGAMPAQPAVKKAGQLPDDKIRQFFEEGYVLVEDFFTPEELEPCRQEILSIVDNFANRLYKADLYSDYGLFQRLIKLENDFTGASILCMKLAAMPKSLQNIWSNERLLNVVEQLIGPDIMGHPVWNLRTKVPHHEETTVPWHQGKLWYHSM
ncbi:hypothetical protein FSP39_008180 [Pinctada imbricata]|uniref:Phytanoyl-CoA dioxygenase n=1 Tax=Pinctada imbricata TaxID=66713 RepID=A0AA89BVZ7_PINIB|nr:hypothetical protein FSP39_008180 [Pinctada imbricata]